MDAVGPGLVRGGGHHPPPAGAAHHHRLAPQLGPFQQLDVDEERVHVHVQDRPGTILAIHVQDRPGTILAIDVQDRPGTIRRAGIRIRHRRTTTIEARSAPSTR